MGRGSQQEQLEVAGSCVYIEGYKISCSHVVVVGCDVYNIAAEVGVYIVARR